jgi:CheY-like chemotaxis protein
MAKILVIDDDAQVREMMSLVLTREGHTVTEAVDGEDGLRSTRSSSFEVVVTDIVMPNKEGLETIVELRRNMPGVKIIAISGGGRIAPTDYLSIAKRLGADRVFAKPVERRALLDAVSELVAEKAS